MAWDVFNCSRDVASYRCEVCRFETHLKIALRSHSKTAHKPETPRPNSVDNCPRTSIDDQEVNQLENSVKQYQCCHCKLQTFSQLFLQKHSQTCRKPPIEKITNLPFYYKRVPNSENQSKNRRISLVTDRVYWFECALCLFTSATRRSAVQHVRRTHVATDDWFQCHLCDFRTKYRWSFKRHRIVKHVSKNDIQWFQCSQCPYKAVRKDAVKRHNYERHGGILKALKRKNKVSSRSRITINNM